MPTYGYLCHSCSREFEVRQRMTDEARAECPGCGAQGRRLFFPAGIVFKGGGFYKTDSRGADGAAAGDAKPAADGGGAKEVGNAAAKGSPDPGAKPAPDTASGAPAAVPKPSSPVPSAPSSGSPPGKSA